ncbi:ISAs1 family transposase [Candidatus Ozemobacteraceae bacterium]|nr:ISAs1 family transposase [Candidatus Ozemobacteraceae bacterium]
MVKASPLFEILEDIEDPRKDINLRHRLHDILVTTICAVICGAEGWDEIAQYSRTHEDWFRTFLELPYGIPSSSTYGRVFARLDPQAFEKGFAGWMTMVQEHTKGRIIALDGKTLRRSFDRASQKAAIHMVSAWTTENGVALAQTAVEAKSNEITAFPKLLDMLVLEGAVVTTDAMGCQTEVAEKIVSAGADYVLAVKENQPQLHDDIEDFFAEGQRMNFECLDYERLETVDGDHGRIEKRTFYLARDLDSIGRKERWPSLKGVGMVEAKRMIEGKESVETRYFITSIREGIETFSRAVRQHWGIENSHHYILDMAFDEDRCRKRIDHSAENFAVVRHIALNLLKQCSTPKPMSVRRKRLQAGWDRGFLLKVLMGSE